MICNTKKQKGNAGFALAIGYFGSNGYIVSLPLNDTQHYDLIVDIDGEIKRVQVKYTSEKTQNNKSYRVRVISNSTVNGKIQKSYTLKETNNDILFVVCEDKTMYLIPKEIVIVGDNLTLTNKFSKYIVNN